MNHLCEKLASPLLFDNVLIIRRAFFKAFSVSHRGILDSLVKVKKGVFYNWFRIRKIKTAFAYWDKRIAPVFDTTQHVHVVTHESRQIVKETLETLPESPLVQKALKLVELGIQTLVCGAISKPLHGMITAYGIRVVSYVAGDLDHVVKAWLDENLDRDVFAMPGCRGQGRRRFRGNH